MDGNLDTSSPSITGSVLTGYLLQFRLLFARNHCLAFSLLFGETKALALARGSLAGSNRLSGSRRLGGSDLV